MFIARSDGTLVAQNEFSQRFYENRHVWQDDDPSRALWSSATFGWKKGSGTYNGAKCGSGDSLKWCEQVGD